MSQEPTSHSRLEQASASDESIQRVHAELLHAKREPKEGYTWMPLFVLAFVSAMIFVVSIYFIHHRGGFSPLVYDERYDPATMADTGPKKEVDPRVAGQRLYNQQCAACHQATGQGIPGAFPPLAGSEYVVGSDERVIKIVVHGLQGPIEVNGATFNGLMPAFGAGSPFNWSDERIAQVLTYIRSEWGNEAGPITTEQVTQVRTANQRTSSWTVEELGE